MKINFTDNQAIETNNYLSKLAKKNFCLELAILNLTYKITSKRLYKELDKAFEVINSFENI